MKPLLSVALCLFLGLSGASPARPAAATRVTSNNLMNVTITNYGCVGNNFVSVSAPSLSYPAGGGFEHLTHGGLWIGARATDAAGPFTGVTTATLDMQLLTALETGTEFTPGGSGIVVRSTRIASPYFNPNAVSEEDLVSRFDDLTPVQAAFNPERHRPLGVQVRQESYSRSFFGYEHILFLHEVIRNVGSAALTDAWVGFYTEFASGRAPYHSPWFSRKWIAYDAGPRLFREHYCLSQPIPAGCNLTYVRCWIGLEVLGVRPGNVADPGDKRVTVAAWSYAPGDPVRDEDVERYAIMSAGTVQNLTTPDLLPATGDPVELVAVGPFAQIAIGDSIEVDVALVGGTEAPDIQSHAQLAQRLYDSHYQILPTSTVLSLVSARAEPEHVRLVWRSPLGPSFTGTVERREERGEWVALADVTADGTGTVEFEDSTIRGGTRYEYRVGVRQDEGTSFFGEVWVEVPRAPGFGLRGLLPNPASAGDLVASFSLAGGEPATFEILDVGGRRLLSREVGGLGAGNHVIRLAGSGGIAPGTYIVRLTQGGRSATSRAVILR